MGAMNKLRTQMAQQFLDALTQGQLPWKACWQQSRPVNAVTGKQYRGVNALYLSYYADELGYSDPRWCTYKQAQDNGWQVRRGSEACKVEYWAYYDYEQKKLLSWQEVRDLLKADPEYLKNLQLRSRIYSVFNAEQIDGIPENSMHRTDIGELRNQRDTLIRNMGVGYEEGGEEAYYTPSRDVVRLPPEGSFDDTYSYMATLLHECGHATGHPSRLDRDLSGGFGSDSYAKEELRAEIASAFTAQALGLRLTDEQLRQHMDQHLAYVQYWAAGLKDAPEELFRAIKAAEEISDYLIERGEFDLDRVNQKVEQLGEVNYTLSKLPGQSGMQLRIFGEGAIPDFKESTDRPFQKYAASIREVVIEKGVTAIGDRALSDLPKLELVSFPLTVNRIGRGTANNCPKLKEFAFTGAGALRLNLQEVNAPGMVMILCQQYPDMNREQLGEIAAGIREGLTPEQIDLYARPEFSSLQMNALRYAINDGLTPE